MVRFQARKGLFIYKDHLDIDNQAEGSLHHHLANMGPVGTHLKCYSFVHAEPMLLFSAVESDYHTRAFCIWSKKLDKPNDDVFIYDHFKPDIQIVSTNKQAVDIFYENHRLGLHHNGRYTLIRESELGPIEPPASSEESAAEMIMMSQDDRRVYIEEIRAKASLCEAIILSGVPIRTVNDLKLIRGDQARPKPYVHNLHVGTMWVQPLPPDDNWRSLYIWGDSGLGKTEWAASLVKCPLVVRSRDTLRDLIPGHHDCIIYDDYRWVRVRVTHTSHTLHTLHTQLHYILYTIHTITLTLGAVCP
jgi:hypothetical protein